MYKIKMCTLLAGTSRENLATCLNESESPISLDDTNLPHNAPLARMSDICTLSTADSQTATVEVICENCNTVMPVKVGGERI